MVVYIATPTTTTSTLYLEDISNGHESIRNPGKQSEHAGEILIHVIAQQHPAAWALFL